MLFFSVYFKTG